MEMERWDGDATRPMSNMYKYEDLLVTLKMVVVPVWGKEILATDSLQDPQDPPFGAPISLDQDATTPLVRPQANWPEEGLRRFLIGAG